MSEHALPFRRCTSGDFLTLGEDTPHELVRAIDEYLSAFVAPDRDEDGRLHCFHCGGVVNGIMQFFGAGVAYEWGMVHGEARCSGCGWPARGMHYPKDANGEEIFALRNFFLSYHPDEVVSADEGGERP